MAQQAESLPHPLVVRSCHGSDVALERFGGGLQGRLDDAQNRRRVRDRLDGVGCRGLLEIPGYRP
ncbi:MAG: hypothetical protein ACRDJF_13275 [Actinomycetota bacterium]